MAHVTAVAGAVKGKGQLLLDSLGALELHEAPYMSASIHLAVATPNCVIMEGGNKNEGPMGNALLREPLEFHPAYAVVSERPGLGVEFDEKALARIVVG